MTGLSLAHLALDRAKYQAWSVGGGRQRTMRRSECRQPCQVQGIPCSGHTYCVERPHPDIGQAAQPAASSLTCHFPDSGSQPAKPQGQQALQGSLFQGLRALSPVSRPHGACKPRRLSHPEGNDTASRSTWPGDCLPCPSLILLCNPGLAPLKGPFPLPWASGTYVHSPHGSQ